MSSPRRSRRSAPRRRATRSCSAMEATACARSPSRSTSDRAAADDAGSQAAGAAAATLPGRARRGARQRERQRHGPDEVTAINDKRTSASPRTSASMHGACIAWPTGNGMARWRRRPHPRLRPWRDATGSRLRRPGAGDAGRLTRAFCPDVVSRGESNVFADPKGYALPTYVADMVTLLARLDATTVHWVGTSMGGLIGMALAGMPGSPISRLVLNDIAPTIDVAGLARIGEYIGKPCTWASEDEAADYLLTISQGFSRTRMDGVDAADAAPGRESLAAASTPAIGEALRGVTPSSPLPANPRSGPPTTGSRARRCCSAVPAPTSSRPRRQRRWRRAGRRRASTSSPASASAPTIVAADQVAVVRDFLQDGARSSTPATP